MKPQLDVIGIVVADMAASLTFYRRLGLDVPASADSEPHVEATLPGGLRVAWDTEETIRSFHARLAAAGRRRADQPGVPVRRPGRGRPGVRGPAGRRLRRGAGPVRRVLGAAVRHRARPGRELGGPVRPAQRVSPASVRNGTPDSSRTSRARCAWSA